MGVGLKNKVARFYGSQCIINLLIFCLKCTCSADQLLMQLVSLSIPVHDNLLGTLELINTMCWSRLKYLEHFYRSKSNITRKSKSL